jgi:hypothetical protein
MEGVLTVAGQNWIYLTHTSLPANIMIEACINKITFEIYLSGYIFWNVIFFNPYFLFQDAYK